MRQQKKVASDAPSLFVLSDSPHRSEYAFASFAGVATPEAVEYLLAHIPNVHPKAAEFLRRWAEREPVPLQTAQLLVEGQPDPVADLVVQQLMTGQAFTIVSGDHVVIGEKDGDAGSVMLRDSLLLTGGGRFLACAAIQGNREAAEQAERLGIMVRRTFAGMGEQGHLSGELEHYLNEREGVLTVRNKNGEMITERQKVSLSGVSGSAVVSEALAQAGVPGFVSH